MRILLTGAAGRLGRATWRNLLDNGHTVVATDRRMLPDLPGKLELAELTDEFAAYKLLEGCDTLIHFGNIPNMTSHMTSQELFRINALANMNIFCAAADLGVSTIVFASSIQSFAWSPDEEKPASRLPYLPVDGDIPAMPGHAYGLSKQVGEDILHMLMANNPGLCCISLRFPYLFHFPVDNEYARRMWARFKMFSGKSPDELSTFLAITDAAELVRQVVVKRPSGYRQYFPALSAFSENEIPELVRTYFPDVPLKMPLDKLKTLVDISRITEDIGWTPSDSLEVKGIISGNPD